MTFRASQQKPVLAALLLSILPAAVWAEGDSGINRIVAALEANDGIAAEAEAANLLKAGRPRSEIAAYMGEAQLLKRNLVEARKWLGPGDFSKATAGSGYRQLGRLNQLEGDFDAAANAYDRANTLIPSDPDLWVDIGRLRYETGAQIQAVEASDFAVRLGPDNPGALQFRGQLLRDSAGPAAAIPLFEKALANHPDDLALMGEYAAVLGETGAASKMLTVTRAMISRDPENPQAHFLQAVLAARAGKDGLAQRLLWKTSAHHRDTPAGLLLSGIIDLKTGNHGNAAQTFDQLFTLQPQNPQVRNLLASALSQAGAHRELIERFGSHADRADAAPYLLTLVARAHEELDERGKAAAYLDRAAGSSDRRIFALESAATAPVAEALLRERPGSIDRARDLLRALTGSGQTRRAAELAAGLVPRYPGSADVRILAGDAFFANGNASGSLIHYGQAAKVRSNASLVGRITAALGALGRRDDARLQLGNFLNSNPLNAAAAFAAGEWAFADGEYALALQYFAHASKQSSSQQDPEKFVLYSGAALKSGDVELAIDLAQDAFELQPASRNAARALMLAYKARGESKAVLAPLRRMAK
ncbi:tetratricopeptide repeat protein [Altererythrobacter aquiaggeris]|uniref:tetratricopeptide repeat protein n=1 Tax=Aestuarierythrobacter aquiaggeris TaxID=1898396 RepID=UPI0030173789